jgi:leucyl aminopeptidase
MLSGQISCIPTVLVSSTDKPAAASEADTVAVGVYLQDGETTLDSPLPVPEQVTALLRSGEAQGAFKSLALAHADQRRWLLVGLGPRDRFTAERARVAAAIARRRARELSTRTLCWQVPQHPQVGAAALAGALVEGTVLADYDFVLFKSRRAAGEPGARAASTHLEHLILSAPEDLERAVERARLLGQAVNEARDLQNRPANDLTPTALADHARTLAGDLPHVSVEEVRGIEGLRARAMGAFAAVAQGSAQAPALITLRYDPPQPAPGSPVLALVGKAVTFDSGGISLKPGAKMAEMKFDMSGGAATLLAFAAIARLGLPIRVIAIIGATENLPSGTAVKPGDIVCAANGVTIEINNTDAEGRLVLADCLCHAVSLGAQAIVDIATLTGGVLIALGSTHAGLISNDDQLAQRLLDAGEQTGEILWRLPMHEEYDALIKGAYADLDNAPEGRRASTIVGGTFLSHFVGEVPWAHVDIAASAWDLGRAYAEKHAAGYGVRLLVALACSYCE